jgi:hypothetical protein
MSTHIYDDPGPHETHTTPGPVPVTNVRFSDGVDHLHLVFTDLDALDETVRLLEEARAHHIDALCDGRSEHIDPALLAPDDLAIINGELVMVESTVISDETVIVRYARKYAGSYDFTMALIATVSRRHQVRRLVSATILAVV